MQYTYAYVEVVKMHMADGEPCSNFYNISQVVLLQLCLARPPQGYEDVKYLAETT
jgi:hypothetical protein